MLCLRVAVVLCQSHERPIGAPRYMRRTRPSLHCRFMWAMQHDSAPR